MNQTRVKNEWLYDVSWSWSDSLPAHSHAVPGEKPQLLTLTMTHNPTRISLIRSRSLVQNKRGKISQLRSRFWLDLFHELQRKILFSHNQAVCQV
jgi:hypothetical protein